MEDEVLNIDYLKSSLKSASTGFEGHAIIVFSAHKLIPIFTNENALYVFSSLSETLNVTTNVIKPLLARSGAPTKMRMEKARFPQGGLQPWTLTFVTNAQKGIVICIINDARAKNPNAYKSNADETWHAFHQQEMTPSVVFEEPLEILETPQVLTQHIDDLEQTLDYQAEEPASLTPDLEPEELVLEDENLAFAAIEDDVTGIELENTNAVELESEAVDEETSDNKPWWIQGEYSEDTIEPTDVDYDEEEIQTQAEPTFDLPEFQEPIESIADEHIIDEALEVETDPDQLELQMEPLDEDLLSIDHVEDNQKTTPMPQEKSDTYNFDRPIRFLWEVDSAGVFTAVSPELSLVVGSKNASIVGLNWDQVCAEYKIDPNRMVGRALSKRDTWSGLHVKWPILGKNNQFVEIELAAIAMFEADKKYRGFRGFGIIKPSQFEAEEEALPMVVNGSAHSLQELSEPIEENIETNHIENTFMEPQEPEKVEPISEINEPLEETPAQELQTHQDKKVVTLKRKKGDGAKLVSLREDDPIKRAEKLGSLNPNEREAFQQIAKALGARLEDEVGASENISESLDEETIIPSVPKKTKEKIRALTEQQHIDMLNQVDVPIAISQLGQVVFANQALLKAFEFPSTQDLILSGGLEKLLQEHMDEDMEGLQEATQTSIVMQDGHEEKVSISLKSTIWEGAPASLWTIQKQQETLNKPIKKAKKAIQETSHIELNKQNLLEALSDDAVLVIDKNDKIIDANIHALSLLHKSQDELIASVATKFFPPKERRALKQLLQDCRNHIPNNQIQKTTLKIMQEDGSEQFIEFKCKSISDQTNEAVVILLRDISQYAIKMQDSIDAQKIAEKENAEKTDYLARIAHEVRTPMNAILGFAELMQEERFGPLGNERYKEYLQDIRLSGQHVISLVNDLLDLSKLKAGKRILDFQETELAPIVTECIDILGPAAQKKHVIIRTSLPTIPNVVADQRSIKQILLNVISNSIKFTPEGGQIAVTIHLENSGELSLRIRDTGCGMSQQEITMALEPFTQINPSEKMIGTGLGLPLSKALTSANRAYFNIESQPGEGTLIEIVFPANRVLAS